MTDSPVLDERAHFTAIKALLDPLVNNHVYDYGTVPGFDNNTGTQPNTFVCVAIERRFVEPMQSGRSARSGWRYLITSVGRLPAEARLTASKVAAAMETRLVVGGIASTPVTHESSQAIRRDDTGRYSGVAFYTAAY